MALTEREFRAATNDGDLVGWIHEATGRPNALLLHGGPGLSEYLDTLVAELDGLVTTARYQQRGLAPSVVSGDISIEGHIADAVAVMDALGWDKPLVMATRGAAISRCISRLPGRSESAAWGSSMRSVRSATVVWRISVRT